MAGERGRPRSFDADAALDRALEVFWRHGFQATSLSELTDAMGLSKPSLYAAFGDKEALYLQCLERYAHQWTSRHAALLDSEPDAQRAVEQFLRSVATMLTNPALPGGCFVINSTADCGASGTPDAVTVALRKTLQDGESLLRERLLRAQRDGQLAKDMSVDELAAFYASLLAGLCVKAKGGAKRNRLNAAIDVAMRAWPADA